MFRIVRPHGLCRRDLLMPGVRAWLAALGFPADLAEAVVTDDYSAAVFDRYENPDAVLNRHPVVYWWPWSLLWEDTPSR